MGRTRARPILQPARAPRIRRRLRDIAFEPSGKPNDRRAALMDLAKLCGLIEEKRAVRVIRSIQDLSDEELDASLRKASHAIDRFAPHRGTTGRFAAASVRDARSRPDRSAAEDGSR